MTSLFMDDLDFIAEPELIFGSGQKVTSPKDGLFLFGPLANDALSGNLRIGVLGTAPGIQLFNAWVDEVRGFIPALESKSAQHRPFPGFAAVFGVELPSKFACELVVTDEQIDSALHISDRHVAIFKTVDIYANAIQRFLNEEEAVVDLWFVVIPERIYHYGRPKSMVPLDKRVDSGILMNRKLAKALISEPSLFDVDNQATEPYQYEVNFHNQLKARLLEGSNRAVVQIVRETAIAPAAFVKSNGMPLRRTQDAATIAWNLCTTAFFKTGKRPWKLARVRDRVCYIGLVFKQVLNATEGSACCGAQMFLDSGDGLVFKSVVGAWRSAGSYDYHLTRTSAHALLSTVMDAYIVKEGCYPSEVFIHGKSGFDNEEWEGFSSALPATSKLVGVRIRPSRSIKLYRPGKSPMLRGCALRVSDNAGFLWTKGFIPYLNTYPGRETPNPLRIDVLRGHADLLTVMADVMALTKLNFNACIFSDGLPVTLRFADAVGEILTAGPAASGPPLPFKHYI